MNTLLLELKNIKKNYIKKKIVKQALKGVSLDIYQGEIIAFLGVNGAGKTTLSSIIASLHPASEGEVLWNGTSIYDNLISYRKIVGLCPQKPNLDTLFTLEENLIFAGKYFGMTGHDIIARKNALLQQFDLRQYAQSYASVLSGGYKQRFLIARTLMHCPKLVILDEPTVGLDPHIRRQLWELILDLKKEGVTVILTTHYLDEADKLADRICFLDNGVVITTDTPENLKQRYHKDKLEEVFLHLSHHDKDVV